VAALLNSDSEGVSYPLTPEEVIEMFDDAFDANGDYEDLKNLFEDFNEAGCPLN